jgi:hypothetical protein
MSLWQREKEHVQHVPLTGSLEVFILILLILEIVKGVIGV